MCDEISSPMSQTLKTLCVLSHSSLKNIHKDTCRDIAQLALQHYFTKFTKLTTIEPKGYII